MSYPSPCEKCTRHSCNVGGIGCEEWRKRYFYQQKRINAYARQALQPKVVTIGAFCYLHPAQMHRLQRSPCEARLKWWDVQVGAVRRKI